MPRILSTLCSAALVVSVWLVSEGRGLARELEPDYQQWLQLQLTTKLSERVMFDLDLQTRRANAPLQAEKDASGAVTGYAENPSTWLMVRPMLGFQALPKLSVWAGYAFAPTLYDNPAARRTKNVWEHRIFQQLTFQHSFGQSKDAGPRASKRWTFSSRTRFEQRYRSRGPGSPEDDGGESLWAFRIREQVRVAYTVVPERPWLIVFWDEVFIHLNETHYLTKRGLDQNRIFLGPAYQVNDGLRVELGYMNHYVKRYTDPNQLNHVLYASLQFKFDLAAD